MSSVTAHIIFQGLIAFAPHYDGGELANRVTALAVDSRLAPQNSACLVDHMPMIEFPATAQNCTAFPKSRCDWSGGKCICPLDRQEITLLPDADPTRTELSRERPEEPLPPSNDAARDFSYVAHLSSLGYSLDPRFLQSAPPAALGARFTFPFNSLLSCDHATRPDDQTENVHSFQFHQLGELGGPDQLHQALAQTLVATISLDTSNLAPMLRLSSFGGGESYVFPLEVVPASGVRIKVMNHHPEILSTSDPCNDGVGRDFALFYELVLNPPAWEDRLLPHVKHTSWKHQSEVDPPECEIPQVPSSRPVCPLAAF